MRSNTNKQATEENCLAPKWEEQLMKKISSSSTSVFVPSLLSHQSGTRVSKRKTKKSTDNWRHAICRKTKTIAQRHRKREWTGERTAAWEAYLESNGTSTIEFFCENS